MKKNTQQSIASSLEADTKILCYMPYLLQDLWVLGSAIDQIINIFTTIPLEKKSTKVLDLGCGKGAVSINIASKFGYKIVGVDAMPEFLKEAKNKAVDLGVSKLCTFVEQDILDFTKQSNNFDVVILASLGGILGTIKDTVKILRTQVKPGGYIIIDDGYLKQGVKLDRMGYEHYKSYRETITDLTFFNDNLISEISTTKLSKEINDEYIGHIEKRIAELAVKYTDLKTDFMNYLELQKEECDVLENEIEGIIWVLEKVDS